MAGSCSAILLVVAWQLLAAFGMNVAIRPEKKITAKGAAQEARGKGKAVPKHSVGAVSNASKASNQSLLSAKKAPKATSANSSSSNASRASSANSSSSNASRSTVQPANGSAVVSSVHSNGSAIVSSVHSNGSAIVSSVQPANGSTLVASNASIPRTVATVTVYYETRCPSCQAFISNTLPLVWEDEEFRKRLLVQFIPFGNAQMLRTKDISPGYKFWHEELDDEGIDYMFPCQHGPDECFGNLLQACAIDVLKEQSKTVPFVICMESNSNKSLEMAAWDCGQAQKVDLVSVKTCMRSSHGNRLMSLNGNVTGSLAPPAGPKGYVPWITINGVHTEGLESDFNGTRSLFMRTLCGSLTEPRPMLCSATTTPALFAASGFAVERMRSGGTSGAKRSIGASLAYLPGALLLSALVFLMSGA